MRATARTVACSVALLGAVAAFTVSAAEAAKPVVGSVSGPITSVKGARFTLTTTLSPTGTSTVSVGSKTVITEQVPGTIADVKKGACVTALGQKSATGTIAAMRITLTQPVKGQCTGGFGRRPGGGRPANAPPRGSGAGRPSGRFGGGFANFGFALGRVSAAKGDTVTVKGSQGSTTVALSKQTQVGEVKQLGPAAIDPKLCAFVQGTSGNRGVTVAATAVGLSKPVSGSCAGRFRQR